MPFDFLSQARFTIEALTALKPPSWTRLEPQSVTGDPRPGIEARVHDPLWFLARQWQFGEFEGEDAGTPLTVRVVTRSSAIDRWAAGDAGPVRAFGRRGVPDLLEPLVEREPVVPGGPGLRARAEAGAALLAALDEAGLSAHRPAFVANCPLDVNPAHHPDGAHAALDPEWLRLVRLLRDRGLADGERICEALEAAADLPAWLIPADAAERDALRAVLDPWRAWYRAEISPPPGGDDAWVGQRLEYHFRAAAGTRVFDAPAHGGGDLDWYSFDAAPDGSLAEPEGAIDAPPERREVHALLASPLRYPGMPADRLWEMEDARVNVGLIEAEPWDLARLLVAEFALTYGNDWLVVPMDSVSAQELRLPRHRPRTGPHAWPRWRATQSARAHSQRGRPEGAEGCGDSTRGPARAPHALNDTARGRHLCALDNTPRQHRPRRRLEPPRLRLRDLTAPETES